MQCKHILLSCIGNSTTLLEEAMLEMSFFEFSISFSMSRSDVATGMELSPDLGVPRQKEAAFAIFNSAATIVDIKQGNTYVKKNALSYIISC